MILKQVQQHQHELVPVSVKLIYSYNFTDHVHFDYISQNAFHFCHGRILSE